MKEQVERLVALWSSRLRAATVGELGRRNCAQSMWSLGPGLLGSEPCRRLERIQQRNSPVNAIPDCGSVMQIDRRAGRFRLMRHARETWRSRGTVEGLKVEVS